MSVNERDLILTARTTFVLEMQHRSNWDISCQAKQIFEAGDRENRQTLEQLILDRNLPIKIISSDTSVVVISKKEK